MSIVRICPIPKYSGEVASNAVAKAAVARPYIARARTNVANKPTAAKSMTGTRATVSLTPRSAKAAPVVQKRSGGLSRNGW